MIKIEFADYSLQIPENWSEIKLADYEKWFSRKPENSKEYIEFIADVAKIDSKVLLDSPKQVFDVIENGLQFIFTNECEPSHKITIDKKDYFAPSSQQITLAEWVDVDNILAGDSPTKVSDILAVICRPVGEVYNPDLLDERKQLFRQLPCDKALPLLAFFLHRKKQSDEISHHYSTVMEMLGQLQKDIETFASNGDGIKQLPIWQRIRFAFLMRSLRKKLSKCLGSSSTETTRHEPKKTNINLNEA